MNLRKTQTGLADYLGVAKSTIKEMLKSAPERGLLRNLDRIAEYLNTTPSDLVRRADTPLVELDAVELRVVAHLRQFPASLREQILYLYDYFGGLLPEERAERRWWLMIRRLSDSDQREIEESIQQLLQKRARKRAPKTTSARVVQSPSSRTAAATPSVRSVKP